MLNSKTKRSRRTSHDTERAQAIVRIVLSVFVYSYLWIAIGVTAVADDAVWLLQGFFACYFLTSLAVYALVIHQPGVYHLRRCFCILLDVGGVVFTMSVGGSFFAPIYGVLLWVTVGYGMRYGTRYLVVATVVALLGLSVIVRFSDYLLDQPHISATLFLTTVIVPFYASILLADTRRAYDDAMAANQSKSLFLAQASHDLRQPVQAIGLFVACLREERLGREPARMVENIDYAMQSIARLYQSLLDVATLDSGKLIPQAEPVCLAALFERLAAQHRPTATRANVELRIAPTSLWVMADKSLLTNVLQNLLSNAIKHAPDGPVLIGCRRQAQTLSILVVDRGPGIAETDHARIFEEFSRVGSQDVEGVGLGLSIVKRMAHLMELEITLTSAVGQGTCFRLDGLPIVEGVPASDHVRHDKMPITPLHGARVLLICTDPVLRSGLSDLLEKWGCVVHSKVGVPEDFQGYDLVIVDFDGRVEASFANETMRQSKIQGVKLPLVALSDQDLGHVRNVLTGSMTTVLQKPVQPGELRAVLLSKRLGQSRVAPSGGSSAP